VSNFQENTNNLSDNVSNSTKPDKVSNKSSPSITCLMFNARDLRNQIKRTALAKELASEKYKIIAITETFWNDTITDGLLLSDPGSPRVYNYALVHKNRVTKTQGGGVALFVHNSLSFSQVNLPNFTDKLEVLAIDLFSDGAKLAHRFACVYRPPYYDAAAVEKAQLLSDFVNFVCSVQCPTTLVGDFNLPNIDWESYTISGLDRGEVNATLLDAMLLNDLSQFVSEPTRIDNVLDLVLSSDPLGISFCSVGTPFATSDHSAVIFELCCQENLCKTNASNSFVLDYKNADYEGMNNFLCSINWRDILGNSSNVETKYNAFLSVMGVATEVYVPKRKNNKNNFRLPKNIRALKARKNALWKNRRNDGEAFKKANKEYLTKLNEHFAKREHKCVNDNDVKKFYSFVNSKIKSSPGISPLRREDGTLVIEDQEKASLLNEFFASVFTVDDNINQSFQPRTDKKKSEVEFTAVRVMQALKKLPNKMSRSPDNLPAFLLKKTALGICEPLSEIFSLSFESGVLPSYWLTADVCAIFKKGATSKPGNYRPVSLTSVCCRVMESIIKQEVVDYLLKHKLISKHQHGFLSRKSVTTQLLESTEEFTRAFKEKSCLDCVYLDYSKAFDSVCHSKLLTKLAGYGISGRLLEWFRAFLTGRTQRVVVNRSYSEYVPVISSVPQGTVCAPLLFLIYVNDVNDCVQNDVTIKLFADDLKVFCCVTKRSTDASPLTLALKSISKWSAKWQLNLACEKCVVVHLGNRNPKRDYFINDVCLAHADSFRDLGVTINHDLSFSKHCQIIAGRALRRVGLIFRAFKSRDPNLLVKAYKTYVRPVLETCTEVWSPYKIKDIKVIERVQIQFTWRLFQRCYWGAPAQIGVNYQTRCSKLNLDTLESRRYKIDLVMCYKILHKYVCLSATDFFKLSDTGHDLKGNKLKLDYPDSRIDVRKYFFAIRVILPWNKLLDTTVQSKTINSFKLCLDMKTINECFKKSRVYLF